MLWYIHKGREPAYNNADRTPVTYGPGVFICTRAHVEVSRFAACARHRRVGEGEPSLLDCTLERKENRFSVPNKEYPNA